MKKLITTFSLICFLVIGAFAQGNFILNGNVIDTNGNPVSNHQVCIFTDSMQTSLVYYNCIFTNSNGAFTVTIPNGAMPGPNVVFYILTQSCSTYVTQQVQNNQGTTSSATVTLLVCSNNPATCNTTFYAIPDSISNPFNYFFMGSATENGTPATISSYSWNFGDGSPVSNLMYPQHTYTASGTYNVCLTTTTSNGCTSSACTPITIASSTTCTAAFGYQSTGANNNTYFNASFGANYDYFWTFGDGSSGTGQFPIHVYSAPGTYTVCLSVIDSTIGCFDQVCHTVTVQSTVSSFYVYGQVSLPGLGFLTPADYGTVYLIRHDSTLLTAIDTTSIDSGGYYFFSNVAPGAYLVKAALDSNSAYYNFYMPTYHTSSLFWTTATNVLVINSTATANINMVAGANPGGPGFIGGSVLQGANRLMSPGDPIYGITILLLDMNNNPIASTTTDINGNYSFPSIAYGTYQIYAEVAGKSTVPSIVTINAANPTVSNVNIEVNSGTILVVYSTAAAVAEPAFGLYPNPAKDILTVSVEAKEAGTVTLVIENNLGQVVLSKGYRVSAGKQNINETISQLAKGVYSISVIDATTRSTSKFVKSE